MALDEIVELNRGYIDLVAYAICIPVKVQVSVEWEWVYQEVHQEYTWLEWAIYMPEVHLVYPIHHTLQHVWNECILTPSLEIQCYVGDQDLMLCAVCLDMQVFGFNVIAH